MRVEVFTELGKLRDLAAAWDDLALEDARDGFFRTSAWYMGWMRHIRPDAQPFVITVRDEEDRLVGLAPLCLLQYRDLGMSLTALAWAGREVVSGDFLDFLSEPKSRTRALAAMLGFLEHRSDWSLLVMGELMEGGDTCTALEQVSRSASFPLRKQEERICPFIALPRTFDQYLNTLSSSTRYHIRRRMRDVEKKGGTVVVHSEPQAVAANLDTMIRLHLARWQKDNQPGTFGRPGFAEFIKEICLAPPAHSHCRLYTLVHEGETVAALLTFFFGQSALYYQAGWHPDSPLSTLSPGVVVMAHSIRDSIEGGYQYYEFLRGDEAYKSRWTSTCRKTITVLLARSFMAKQYLTAAHVKDRLKERFLAKRPATDAPAEQWAASGDSHAAL